MAHPDMNQLYSFKNAGKPAKTKKSHFKPPNFIFRTRRKGHKEESRLLRSRKHFIINATPTGTETGREIVQNNKLEKTSSLEINKTVNYKTEFNTPILTHINGVIETNQKCEQMNKTHT